MRFAGKVGKPTKPSRAGVKKAPTNTRENRKKLQHIKSLKKKEEVLHSKKLGTSAGPPKIIVRHVARLFIEPKFESQSLSHVKI